MSISFVPFSVKLNQSLLVLHEAFLDHLNEKRLHMGTDKTLQVLPKIFTFLCAGVRSQFLSQCS